MPCNSRCFRRDKVFYVLWFSERKRAATHCALNIQLGHTLLRSWHRHKSGMHTLHGCVNQAQQGLPLQMCDFVYLNFSLIKEGKPTSNAKILSEARVQLSRDIITFTASELSRVKTETVSYHFYTDILTRAWEINVKTWDDDLSTEISV